MQQKEPSMLVNQSQVKAETVIHLGKISIVFFCISYWCIVILFLL